MEVEAAVGASGVVVRWDNRQWLKGPEKYLRRRVRDEKLERAKTEGWVSSDHRRVRWNE